MQLLQELIDAQTAGTPVALATIVKARGSVPRHAGTKMLVYEDGRISGTIGGGEMEARVIQEAHQALNDGQTRIVPYALISPERGDPGVCGGEVEIYVEPYLPPATLLVVGCGHVGRALASLAHWLGYRVIVTDDREALVTPALIPYADKYVPGPFEQIINENLITKNTFVTLVTRNVMVDREIVPQLLKSPAAYIGVMGSRRRWRETQKLLLADGMPNDMLSRIHSPLGLELNAETPEEIALSVLSEITMLRRGGTGRPMQEDDSD